MGNSYIKKKRSSNGLCEAYVNNFIFHDSRTQTQYVEDVQRKSKTEDYLLISSINWYEILNANGLNGWNFKHIT